MTKKELEQFITDAAGFINWSVENKKDANYMALNLIHDIMGLARKDSCFVPRVSGYGKHFKG
jgi:hypothetical protein